MTPKSGDVESKEKIKRRRTSGPAFAKENVIDYSTFEILSMFVGRCR
jgi:hypothetical protein